MDGNEIALQMYNTTVTQIEKCKPNKNYDNLCASKEAKLNFSLQTYLLPPI